MTLLDSLLDAILRLDGEALVMHAGEKPYVVLSSASMSTFRGPLSWGQVELSSRPLTTDAVLGMLAQMLSPEQSRALDRLGAIEQEIDAPGDSSERFVVTAARGGEDVWVEVRRHTKVVEAPAAPAPVEEPQPASAVQPERVAEPEPVAESEPVAEPEPQPEPVFQLIAEEDVHDINVIEEDVHEIDAPIFEIASMPGFAIQTEAARVDDDDEHEAGVFDIPAGGVEAFEIDPDAPVFEIAPRAAGAQAEAAPVIDLHADDVPVIEITSEPVSGFEAVLDFDHEPAREPLAPQSVTALEAVAGEPAVEQPAIEEPVAEEPVAVEPIAEAPRAKEPIVEEPVAVESVVEEPAVIAEEPAVVAEEPGVVGEPAVVAQGPVVIAEQPVVVAAEEPVAVEPIAAAEEEPAIPQAAMAEELPVPRVESAAQAPAAPEPQAEPEPEPQPVSVVVPHARPTFKLHQPPPPPPAASKEASLIELLRTAAAQRASTVYAVVDTRPMMRVEGQISLVGTHPSVAAGDVERFIFEFAPREHVGDAAPEWTCNVPGIGRVRCVTFHDHSGAGLIFHLPAGDASTADELGIPSELQALCSEPDGLIVVAGPRSSGKSTLLGAFVDLINRTRYDHVITIESEIRRVHEKRLSFISQREVRGDGDAIAAAARAALREGPDVLVIEDLRAPEALIAALDAARAGRLVFGSISARTAPAAVERLIDAFPADRRSQIRALLAGSLRSVIAQLLVPKAAGGRIAAREVLLSSPAVRKLVLDGAIEQLRIAIESGRTLGMRTMVDSLGALVRDEVVDIREACACAPDRAALVSALERDGIDVTGVERRA